MRQSAPAPHRIEAHRLDRVGWRADHECMARATGAVALLPATLHEAPSAEPLCDALHACGCATLRIDAEPGAGITTLTGGLVEALEWLRSAHRGVPLGVFGVGAGADAALNAAASRPELIAAVVALQAEAPLEVLPLGRVCAATLLVVGRDDPALLDAHRSALPRLGGARRLEIVPGAGDRTDALAAQAVAHLAAQWFAQRLPLRELH